MHELDGSTLVTGGLDLVAQRQDPLDQFGQPVVIITGKARRKIQYQTGTVGSWWEQSLQGL